MADTAKNHSKQQQRNTTNPSYLNKAKQEHNIEQSINWNKDNAIKLIEQKEHTYFIEAD